MQTEKHAAKGAKQAAGKPPAGAGSKRTPASERFSKPSDLEKDEHLILVPVDFSTHSETALVYAARLADRMRATMAVLHVVHDPGEAPGYYRSVKGQEKLLRRLEDVAAELLESFLTNTAKRYPELSAIKNAKRVLVTGLPVTRILEVAELAQPEMVVVGSAGRTAFSRLLLGSKAEQLLRLCPFPITVVRANKKTEQHQGE